MAAVLVALGLGPRGAFAEVSGPSKPASSMRTVSSPMATPAVSPRAPNMRLRRSIAGGSVDEDAAAGVESPELAALRAAERELFPATAADSSGAWPGPSELLRPWLAPTPDLSGLPRGGSPRVPTTGALPDPPAWLAHLKLPDIPVRWSPRLVSYLELFKNDPRGRGTFSIIYRRAGRYRNALTALLQRKGLPEDLLWVAFVESGFEPTARSYAGAVGMWQLMPATAGIYGLRIDRWLDERMAPERATEAAVEFLADMRRRFGTWELALAGYHMGYGGIASVIKRHNTNDFWTLSDVEGALPWLTTLYVPKILAVAIVARNLEAFGFSDLTADAPLDFDTVGVPPGTPLSGVARACGVDRREIEGLNPELRASRTPPATEKGQHSFPVRVPKGRAAAAAKALATLRDPQELETYVVRFGETLAQVASARGTSPAKLIEVNGLSPSEVVRGGTVLLVPPGKPGVPPKAAPAAASPPPKLTVVVPADIFVYPGRKRVFYRAQVGDTLDEIAGALSVSVSDLCRWNTLDPAARLIEGMTLQAFVRAGTDLSHVVLKDESEVHVVPVGSDEFFASGTDHRGLVRVTVPAHEGETLESIGRQHHVAAHTMERVNRRERSSPLHEGEPVVLYLPASVAAEKPPAKVALGLAPPPPGAPKPKDEGPTAGGR